MTLAGELERCAPWLCASLARNDDDTTIADLHEMFVRGEAQLWPGPDAAVVTQVSRDDEAGLVLTLWLVGGELRTAQVMLPLIEAEMKTVGCAEVRFAPHRPGWVRVAKAFGFEERRPGVWGKEIA